LRYSNSPFRSPLGARLHPWSAYEHVARIGIAAREAIKWVRRNPERSSNGGSSSSTPEISNDSSARCMPMERSDYGGAAWLGHSGSYGGYESELWTDPQRGMTLAVTTNMDERDSAQATTSGRIWDALADALDHAGVAGSACNR
jgi:CubicO group peptidase (beta-lactamase class C family)